MPTIDIAGRAPRGGKVLRVVGIGGSESTDTLSTKALIKDPFTNVQGYGAQITVPPYSLEQLVLMAESHPVHSSCIDQKVADIIGSGVQIVSRDESQTLNDKEVAEILRWWEGLFDRYTPIEALTSEHGDNQTIALGFLEVARDKKGVVGRLHNIPGHTMRAHASGRKWVQMRWGQQRWFKEYGEEKNYNLMSGEDTHTDGQPPDLTEANEVLVFRRPSRRSTWYGVPSYIAAIGHLALAVNARDFNALFFANNREPRVVYVIEGLEENVDPLIDQIADALATQHIDPHKNLLIPVTGDAKVHIERIALQANDMHFTKLMDMCDEAILMAHRMPPDRIGKSPRGALGGNAASVLNRIYKDAVVAREQDILEDRLGKFMITEYNRAHGKEVKNVADSPWRVDFEQLDVKDEAADTAIVVQLVKIEEMTLNEGRQKIGLPPRDEFKDPDTGEDMTLMQWMKAQGVAGQQEAPPGGVLGEGLVNPDKGPQAIAASYPDSEFRDYILRRVEDIDGLVEELTYDDDDRYTISLNGNGHREEAFA